LTKGLLTKTVLTICKLLKSPKRQKGKNVTLKGDKMFAILKLAKHLSLSLWDALSFYRKHERKQM